jgi:ankyrin repeat protein
MRTSGAHGKKVAMSTESEEPARQLPANPDLRHLKDQAKDLLKTGEAPTLACAQFQIARQYGFASWPKLKAHVESLQRAGQLKLAIDANDLEAVKRLMTRHPELHRAPLGYGKNGPLAWVAECRVPRVPPSETRLAMAQWMIENGSDVHQGGDGPLMRAALDDSKLPMTELLVAHGADVNAVWGGTYPVILAPLETFAPRTLKWMLDHGADLHAAKNCDPIEMLTCIYSRRAKEKRACFEIVAAAGFALPDTPVMALHRGRLDMLQEHLDRDPSLLERRFAYREIFFNRDGAPGDAYPATPVSGGTLLHLALEFDDLDVARWLIERGADVNARAIDGAQGSTGHTPLFHTVATLAYSRDDSGALLLLDHGADPNARATFPLDAMFHGSAPTEQLHDVTPIGYARRHPDEGTVNAPALAAIIERGGTE